MGCSSSTGVVTSKRASEPSNREQSKPGPKIQAPLIKQESFEDPAQIKNELL